MIELVTGLPGNGKTLYTLSTVKARAEKDNRPVFYSGIPELTLNWEKLEDPREWATCPPGAIVVIDEAQKIFRNRSMGTTPPEFVQKLETHRHLGIDLVLITQHPSLIDPSVRRLAGAHRHLVRMWGTEMSTVHAWPSVKDNCDKSRADSEKTKWAFDKKAYAFYKSAEVHTVKRSIPARVKLIGALVIVFGLAVWYVVSFVGKKVAGKPAPAQVVTRAADGMYVPAAGYANTNANTLPARHVDPVEDARDYAWRETPRIVGLQQTAPKYDALTAPVRVPVPAMCVQIGDPHGSKEVRCKCYSQQGTPLPVEFNMCIEFARNGFFQDFNPDSDKAQVAQAAASQDVMRSYPEARRPEYAEVGRGPAVAVLPDMGDVPLRQVRVSGETILKK